VKHWNNISERGKQMSILEKFFKNKKEVPELEETPMEVKEEVNITHATEISSDGRLYKTETADLITQKPFSFLNNCHFSSTKAYFVTPKGNFFSADAYAEIREVKKDDVIVHELNIIYGNLKPEPTEVIKMAIGKSNIELYEKYFGEEEKA